jgi:hypothetical protein
MEVLCFVISITGLNRYSTVKDGGCGHDNDNNEMMSEAVTAQ